MMECPHSIYFFRNSVENFGLIDDYKGRKTADELLSDVFLIPANEGDYYQASQAFTTNSLYVDGVDKQIEIGDYVEVVRIQSGNNYIYRYKIMGDSLVNTLRDWHIVPLGRPVVNPPEQKLHVVDIPGANGILDLSNSLTKYPVFNNRTGSWSFAILSDETDTPTSYSKMLNFLQGTDVKVMLEDDMNYYYQGRVYVESISPNSDGTCSEVSIGYDLFPYKQSINTSIDDWLWDTFNFETDSVVQSVFKDIPIPPDFNWHQYDFSDYIDKMPVVPTITVTNDVFHSNMDLQLYNSDLGINWKQYKLSEGTNYFNDLMLCKLTKESKVMMRFKCRQPIPILDPTLEACTKITIQFRSGRL